MTAGKGGDLQPGDAKERPDDGASFYGDRSEAGKPRSLDQAQQEGFHLVVPVVGDCDPPVAVGLGNLREIAVAYVPARVLDGKAVLPGVCVDVGTQRVAGRPVLSRKLFDEGLVAVGLCTPQLVVYVGDGQAEAYILFDLFEQKEEGRGIDPAGHPDQHRITRVDQPFLPDDPPYALVELHQNRL